MAQVPIYYMLTQAGDKLSYTFIQVKLCMSRERELLYYSYTEILRNNVNIVYSRVRIKERTDHKINKPTVLGSSQYICSAISSRGFTTWVSGLLKVDVCGWRWWSGYVGHQKTTKSGRSLQCPWTLRDWKTLLSNFMDVSQGHIEALHMHISTTCVIWSEPSLF